MLRIRSVKAAAWPVAAALCACGGGNDPGGTAPDTQLPTVSIAAPASGMTVSGNVEVSAIAADNDAVVGVQFQLDGEPLAAELRAAPYRFVWATTVADNGARVLAAVARDAAGNAATSPGVPVTVSNLPPPPPGSIEVTTTTSGTGTDPDGYLVAAAGVQRPIAANGAVTLPSIPPGTHAVALTGLSPYCAATEGTSRTVTVASGAVTTAAFALECMAPPSGRIAYLENTFSVAGLVVRIAEADGTGDVAVIGNVVSADWSPDGTQLAFIRHADGLIATLHRIDADGTDAVQLAALPLNARDLAWGPAGTMAFSALRAGSGATSIHDVFLIDSDGSNVRPLAAQVAKRSVPAFSPDGERLAVSISGTGEEFSIWILDRNGSNAVQLTSGFRDVAGDWSPDGTRLLFSRQTVNFNPTDIFVIGIDGSGLQQLTSDLAFDYAPDWAPDGNWIAFTSDRQPSRAVWIMRTDGSLTIPLDGAAARGGFPRWTP